MDKEVLFKLTGRTDRYPFSNGHIPYGWSQDSLSNAALYMIITSTHLTK